MSGPSAFLKLLIVGIFVVVLAAPAKAATSYVEQWASLANWTLDQPAHASVSGGQLTTSGDVVLAHSSLLFRRDQSASLSGTVTAPDIRTQTPNYCGMVLLTPGNTNYYGSLAPNNWVDTLNGILPPNVIDFGNEYQYAAEYWSHYSAIRKSTSAQPHTFTLSWAPSLPDGSRGRWTYAFQGLSTQTSPDLPMPGDLQPRLYVIGRCVVGQLTMSGTP